MSTAFDAWTGSGRPNRGPLGRTAPDRQRAIEMRLARTHTVPEIAKQLGYSPLTVYRWTRGALDSHGNAYPAAIQAEAVRLRMREGLTNAQIAARLNMHPATIWDWMGATPKRLGGHRPHPPTLHERADYLRDCGYTVSEIAAEMRLPRSTVGDWVRREAAMAERRHPAVAA